MDGNLRDKIKVKERLCYVIAHLQERSECPIGRLGAEPPVTLHLIYSTTQDILY